ncbi:MAG TPA: BTAD domain-containing putative transcriptional regulator [Gemmatimonas sp.]|uniref:BTAD domain-containing putative transcriptional regulator n=1 Tax=Gemmatimonas sp. TaxID=1962908 RepID=UPI002EDA0B8B
MNRFVTFGGCAVVSSAGEVRGAATQQRRLALLAVLARGGERGVSRTRLLSLFWPDEEDEERSRKALAQALYALRRDLGDERVITGSQELKLDAEFLPHDVGEFAQHLRHGRHAEAVALYDGPFLSGFHLVSAPAFERWADEERRVLERDYTRALETLATTAERQGQLGDAIAYWRKLAAVDPLDSQATLSLMRALAANGEVAAAIRQAAIHETLIQQELELPPDRDVMALAMELRARQASTPAVHDAPTRVDTKANEVDTVPVPTPADTSVPASVDTSSPSETTAPQSTAAPRRRWSRTRWIMAAAGIAAVAAFTVWGVPALQHHEPAPGEPRYHAPPSIAVGLIADFRTSSSGPVRSLAALLATSLARSEALRVVSAARLSELLHHGGVGDSTEAAYISAARHAGAHELIDGSLFDPGDGTLRLDLRRVDVESGAVLAALTIRGTDLFALADSGTARLLDGFGIEPLAGSVRDVTTRSAVAHRFYAEGMKANASYDLEAARRLFGEALRADSQFAMAAYEYARANPNRAEMAEEMSRALHFAKRATARERLIIRAGWASTMQVAGLKETADSLLQLDQSDPQALLFAAEARLNLGMPGEAIPLLQRALTIDSAALSALRPEHCYACEAVQLLSRAYMDQDNPDAAIAIVKRWVDRQPQSTEAWASYSRVLDFTGRLPEASRALDRALALNPAYPAGFVRRTSNLLRAARLTEAEQLAREQTTLATTDQRLDGWWQLATILRHQGRMREALVAVNRFRAVRDTVDGGRMALNHAYLPAFILADAGRTPTAIALFDSMATGAVRPGEHDANVRRLRTIALTAAADLVAQQGDTTALHGRLRAIEEAGAQSGVVRDTRAHHYVRGLLWRARGKPDLAIAEWQAAMAPPLRGYHSRINIELARALVARGEPDAAITAVRFILRDVVDGIAVTQTEMHEVLAQAHHAAGRADSASWHADWVQRAWSRGEPAYITRAQRLTSLVATRATR